MTVYVFVGPSLPTDIVRSKIDAVCLPPAAGGDIYRAALSGPEAIGLIDGLFVHTPAVWHKEILWAMAEGIHVFGAAGLGALRAAELGMFGMDGVGTIFEAYRDGVLEDDDEVAVEHADAEQGYIPLSEAMINIRFTLAAAQEAAVVTPATCIAIEQIAKDLFYPQRSYASLLEHAAKLGVPPEEVDALGAWLPSGRVDQMRADAIEMLDLMRERLRLGLPRKEVRYVLEQTEYWDRIQHNTGNEAV